MRIYTKFELEVLEIEEDVVRTSGVIGGGDSSGSSVGGGNGDNGLEDPNKNDDIIEDWGI